MGFNVEKFLNNTIIIIGAILVGIGTGSVNVGLGIWFIAFGLLPTE